MNLFTEISLVLVIVAVISLVMRLLRQPLIMGYILTGILVGPSMLNVIQSREAFEGFSNIGIALLLFIIGLGLNATIIKGLGKVALFTSFSVFVLVGVLCFGLSESFGFSFKHGIVIAAALLFSSTIIVLKMLSDKRETARLYGQIAVGILLIEDIVATVVILGIGAIGTAHGLHIADIALLLGKGIGLGLTLFLVGAYIMPRIVKSFAKSQEFLFIFTMAWAFGVATLFDRLGLSHEVGALFAGVSLASLPYASEMSSRLKPLRDFFIVLFFVTLGNSFAFDNLSGALIPALVLAAVVLIGKPLFVMSSLGALGYTKLTSFKTAVHLSQISEFSIILTVFAMKVGLADERVVGIVTLVAFITIGLSTYLMKYDDQLYRLLESHLGWFERKNIREKITRSLPYTAIVFGYQHGGHEFVETFRAMKQRYLVVDYDPEIIDYLDTQGIRHAYGDATDEEFLEEINASKAKIVVSTMTDHGMNQLLLNSIRKQNSDNVFICHADGFEEADRLYDAGASYVILPHFLGSERISGYIQKHGIDKNMFESFRKKHVIAIGDRALRG